MQTYWNTIETWLKWNALPVFKGLNPPATEHEIAQAEAALGLRLPDDLAATYRIHNGQSPRSPWLFDGWEFLSLQRMVDEWTVWKQLLTAGEFSDCLSLSDGITVTDWWSPLWIPLTHDGGGNCDCLDLNPGPEGENGQIIKLWHGDAHRQRVASSYTEWISTFASNLESDKYHLSDRYDGVVLKTTDDDKNVLGYKALFQSIS